MDHVELVAYDPAWPAMFDTEALLLRAALPPAFILRMEHFGSTAIPGIEAKPIIDILIAVASVTEARRIAPPVLEAMGYAFWAENPKPDRLFFVKGLPPSAPRRTHHVHMTEPDGEIWQRLCFRDLLRGDPAERDAYQALKHQLAVKFREDREAYSAAKTDYVTAAVERAKARFTP
jgi:GrpB-like predicted nucleotidyltransferase (UPF0157 family)